MKIKNQNSRTHKDFPAFLVMCIMIIIAISLGVISPVYSQGITSADNDMIASVPLDINCSYQTNTAFEAQVVELINAERTKVGLLSLYAQSQLGIAARLHSADMACNDFFSHTGSDGSSPADRIMRQGYSGYYFGENIAAGYSTPESVVNAWMNSAGHRANILNTNYTEIGIGYAYWAGSTYNSYWTTDFAVPNTYSISGKAGTQGGVILSYLDGTTKTVQTDASGNYAIRVPSDWSGSVTPSHTCYTFNPTSRSYTNVITNQTGQNYTAAFDSGSGCANVDVTIGGDYQNSYGIPPGASLRENYAINIGPVQITSTNAMPLIAGMRAIWQETGGRTSYSELMGLPKEELSTEYWFPWYNNLAQASMDQQFRIGNAGVSSATVKVYVGSNQLDSFTLGAGESVRKNYDVNNGPIRVVSDGLKIIATMRVIWQETGQRTSYSELMGLPKEQLSTEYWFPWYNNLATTSMDQQFRIGNAGVSSATVKVYVGSSQLDSFTLGVGASVRKNYDVNNGPIRVVSDGPKIIAAMRVIWQEPGQRTSYSELMGLPKEQLSTEYWFPWYNNLATTSMDQQFRIGNAGVSSATVKVYVGSSQLDSFTLGAGESVRKNYDVNNGPIRVVSDGPKIIAAMRVIWQEPGQRTSYSELMGLPKEQLSTEYWFPWYNNLATTAMDQQFRFGVP